jgi:tRNA G18 (ribose-2'-O)-methylase SpoU
VDQQVINSSDVCLEIPQFGTKHSLNVASSASIAIWDIWNKIRQ